MDVTPHELLAFDIADAFRGYNKDEVNDLLERAAATIETQAEKIRILTERVGSAVAESGRTRDNDDILQRTLIMAQRAADDAVNGANDQARLTIEQANAEASEILTSAHDELQRVNDVERGRIEREILDLAARRDLLVDDVSELERWDGDYRERLISQIESDLTAARHRPTVTPATRPTLAHVELDDLTTMRGDTSDGDDEFRQDMHVADRGSRGADESTLDLPIASLLNGDARGPLIEIESTTVTDSATRSSALDGSGGPLVGSASASEPGASVSQPMGASAATSAAGETMGWNADPARDRDATMALDAEPIEALLERPVPTTRRAAVDAQVGGEGARSSYLDEVLSAPVPRGGADIDLRAAETDRASLDDDAFFATLREAVRDDAPLGPSTAEHAAADERDPSFREMFKRRR